MKTPNITTNKKGDVKMSTFKDLVGKRVPKKVKFMGEEVEIVKLNVSEVMAVQERAKVIKENETEGFNIMRDIIRMGAPNAKDLTDEDFDQFPLDELNKLSSSIMSHSGIGPESTK